MSVAIVDLDGTLVDTNYQHALAWYRAFLEHDIVLAVWRVHRHVGMGGDQLVGAVAGDSVERRLGDRIRAAQKRFYAEMIGEARPFSGAHELVRDIRLRGHRVVLASSADPEEVEHYVALLDVGGLVDGWTTAASVQETKPQPDLVNAALELARAAPTDAVMIGDSCWDLEAAARAGVPSVAVLSGGFSSGELLDAGAAGVYESVADLRAALAQPGVGRWLRYPLSRLAHQAPTQRRPVGSGMPRHEPSPSRVGAAALPRA